MILPWNLDGFSPICEITSSRIENEKHFEMKSRFILQILTSLLQDMKVKIWIYREGICGVGGPLKYSILPGEIPEPAHRISDND